jgi:XTP/dITP diphosphohydrolase
VPERVVLATRNTHKVSEIRAALAMPGVCFDDLDDYPDLPEVVEDGATFLDNARKKAHEIARASGRTALADDSGLVVPALGGEPGVRSARYAGESADDAANRRKLVERLRTLRMDERVAHFVCVLVLATPAGDETTAEGFCHGNLLLEERGSRGFGYDSLFVPEGFDRTFAEMTQPEKAALSHRGRALARLAKSWPR